MSNENQMDGNSKITVFFRFNNMCIKIITSQNEKVSVLIEKAKREFKFQQGQESNNKNSSN